MNKKMSKIVFANICSKLVDEYFNISEDIQLLDLLSEKHDIVNISTENISTGSFEFYMQYKLSILKSFSKDLLERICFLCKN